jgi:hypothetical protein
MAFIRVALYGWALTDFFDGVEDILVSAAAADIPAHLLPNVCVGGCVVFFQETDGRADLTGGTIAALKGVVF